MHFLLELTSMMWEVWIIPWTYLLLLPDRVYLGITNGGLYRSFPSAKQ